MGQLDSPGQFKLIQSDLFECECHLEEICDIMCVATAGGWSLRENQSLFVYCYCLFVCLSPLPTELSSLLPVVQLSEALLRLRNGPHLLARVLANMPDSFDQGKVQQTQSV